MRKIKTNLKFCCTSAGKSTFCMQNDTDSANYIQRAKNIVRISYGKYFNAQLALASKHAFPQLMRNTLFSHYYFNNLTYYDFNFISDYYFPSCFKFKIKKGAKDMKSPLANKAEYFSHVSRNINNIIGTRASKQNRYWSKKRWGEGGGGLIWTVGKEKIWYHKSINFSQLDMPANLNSFWRLRNYCLCVLPFIWDWGEGEGWQGVGNWGRGSSVAMSMTTFYRLLIGRKMRGWGGRRHLKYFWSNSEWLVRRPVGCSR